MAVLIAATLSPPYQRMPIYSEKRMQRLNRKKVTILVIGYIHRDPATIVMLRELIDHYQSQHVKMVMCEEDNAEAMLETRLSGNKVGVKNAEYLLKMPDIKKHLIESPELKYSYFPLSSSEILASVIEKHFPHADSLARQSHLWCILRKNYYSESIALTEQLMHYNIPYHGIESHSKEQTKILKSIEADGNDAFVNHEQARINVMTTNILGKGLASLKGDGLIIAKCGANHAQRLAANIQKRLNDDVALTTEADFQIISTTMFSPYVMDGMPSHQAALALTSPDDSSEIIELQKKNPTIQVIFAENKGLFTADKLAEVNEMVLSHLPSATHYIIPDWNSEKNNLLEKLGGKLISINGKTGKILIDSAVMKKDIRDEFGVCRRLVTLKGDVAGQLAALKQQTEFTVEPKFKSNQYLVTLPSNKLVLLENIINGLAVTRASVTDKFTQFSKQSDAPRLGKHNTNGRGRGNN